MDVSLLELILIVKNRINPDCKKFNISFEIGKIYNHINELNKKLTEELTKKSLTDNLSRRLLELELMKISL